MWYRYRSAALLILALCLLSTGPASAIFWALDDTETDQGWTQRFVLRDVGLFDYMRIDLVNVVGQSQFANPAFSRFSSGGWNEIGSTPTLAEASGPDESMLFFNISFTQTWENGVTFRFAAYDQVAGEMLWRDAALLAYSGKEKGGWMVTPLDRWNWDPAGTVTPVPEPATVALLGPGLVLLGVGIIRKRRGANRRV